MAEPFFFWGDRKPGEPGSYESLLARRRIAEQLMGKRSPYPKNIGEGIASLGESIGDTLMLRDLERRERAQAGYQAELLRGAPGFTGGGYQPDAGGAPPAVAPPRGGTGVGVPPPAAIPPPAVAPRAAVPPDPGALFTPARRATVDPASRYYESPPGVDIEPGRPARVLPAEKDIENPIYAGGISPLDADAIIAEGGIAAGFRDNPDVDRFGGTAAAIARLSPAMRAQINAAYLAMPESLRPSFVINEGGRTREQQDFYHRRAAGRYPAAPAGSSLHEIGDAVDVDRGGALDWLHGPGGRGVGLAGIGPNDYGHIQRPRGSTPGRVPGGVRDALTEVLARRADLDPRTAPPEVAAAPPAAATPAAVPSPGPPAPGSGTPLAFADAAGGEVAALPPNPVITSPIPPAPAGGAAGAALGAGTMPPMGPESPAGAVAALPPAMPAGPITGPARTPNQVIQRAPSFYGLGAGTETDVEPPWLRNARQGPVLPAPSPAGAPAAAPPPVVAPPVAAAVPPVVEPPVRGPATGPAPITAAPPGAGGSMGAVRPQVPEPELGVPLIADYEPAKPQPQPRGMSDAEKYWTRAALMPGIDDRTRTTAEYNLKHYEAARAAADARDLEQWKHDRDRRDVRMDKRDEALRNVPKDKQEAVMKLLQSRALYDKDPYNRAQAAADLEKVQTANRIALQEEAAGKAPGHIKFENGKFGLWSQKDNKFVDITPDVNPLDVDLGETGGKRVEYYARATDETRRLRGDARALNNIMAAMATRKLGDAGRWTVPEQYQSDYNRAKAWSIAMIRAESGAAVPEHEIEEKMSLHWPASGNPQRVIDEKTIRRGDAERALYVSLGKGRPVADFYAERRTDEQEGSVREKPGRVPQIVRGGLWIDMKDGR